jgi:hypothetical protein
MHHHAAVERDEVFDFWSCGGRNWTEAKQTSAARATTEQFYDDRVNTEKRWYTPNAPLSLLLTLAFYLKLPLLFPKRFDAL